ncbi:hypothetical protein EJ110_NYTH34760 [Nymphaea thermarum]|nr:hypothetical protein EJ110_NYTH34760 [Nymphaea thermarum]
MKKSVDPSTTDFSSLQIGMEGMGVEHENCLILEEIFSRDLHSIRLMTKIDVNGQINPATWNKPTEIWKVFWSQPSQQMISMLFVEHSESVITSLIRTCRCVSAWTVWNLHQPKNGNQMLGPVERTDCSVKVIILRSCRASNHWLA